MITLDPCTYRLPAPYHHVSVARTYYNTTTPWYIIRGRGDGIFPDYWRGGEGWAREAPSRYATAEEAAEAFLAEIAWREMKLRGRPQ